MPLQAASEHFKHEVHAALIVRAINNSESTMTECGSELARIVSMRPAAFDSDHGGRFGEAGEQLKQTRATLGEL